MLLPIPDFRLVQPPRRALRRSFLGEADGSVLERVLTGGGRIQPQAFLSASQSLRVKLGLE